MLPRAKVVPLGPWHKGVYWHRTTEAVPGDAISSMENVRIDSGGDAVKRDGCASYKSLAALAGTPRVDMVAEFTSLAATTHVVIVAGTKIYTYDAGTTAWLDITGALTITTGTQWEWADANGTLVACNGNDAPWKWSGTSDATAIDLDGRFTTPKHVAYWEDRLWFANEATHSNRVWVSDPGDIETWDATNYYNIGYAITGLCAFDDMLTMHSREGIHSITATGNTTIPFELQQVTAGGGSVSGRAIVNLSNRAQVFPLSDGIYRWTKGEEKIEKVSYQLDERYWPYLNDTKLSLIFGLYWPFRNEVWFCVPYGASQTTLNHIIIYNEYDDPDDGESYRWYGPLVGGSAFERASGTLVDGKPHLGSYAGVLYDHVSGYTDAGTAVAAWFTTGAPSPDDGDGSLIYRWLFARINIDPIDVYTVSISQNSGDGTGTNWTANSPGAGFTLDDDELDIGSFVERWMPGTDMRLLGFSRNTALTFSNSLAAETFKVHNALLHCRELGRMRRRSIGV